MKSNSSAESWLEVAAYISLAVFMVSPMVIGFLVAHSWALKKIPSLYNSPLPPGLTGFAVLALFLAAVLIGIMITATAGAVAWMLAMRYFIPKKILKVCATALNKPRIPVLSGWCEICINRFL